MPDARTEPIDLAEKLARIATHWDPKLVAELNGQHLRLVKLLGEFVWHRHETEDELFLVLAGTLRMQLRDRELTVAPGEFVIVPHGTEHRPVADAEVHVLLLEPSVRPVDDHVVGVREALPRREDRPCIAHRFEGIS